MSDESGKEYSESNMEKLLAEILEKGGFSLGAFGAERSALLLFSYIITSFVGARLYGFISVFTRGTMIARALYASIVVSNNRTLPRYDTEGQRSILTLNLILMLSLWAIAFILLVFFRSQIVSNTLLLTKHSESVVVFAVWLLPIITLYFVGSAFRSFRQIRISVIINKIALPAALLLGSAIAILVLMSPTTTEILLVALTFTSVLAGMAVYLLYRDTIFEFQIEIENKGAATDFTGFLKTSSAVGILGFAQRGSVFILLAVLVSPVGAGLFSLALILAKIARWPLDGINEIMPAIATKLHDGNQSNKIDRLYKRTSRIALLLAMPISIPLIVFHTEILASFSEEYIAAAIILPIVIIGQNVATAIGSVGILLMMTDNEDGAVVVNLINVIVILPVILYLTSQYGVLGLGVGYGFSLVFNNITEATALWYLEGFVALTKEHFYIVGLAAVCTIVLYAANLSFSLVLSLPLSIIGICLYTVASYTFILDSVDKKAIFDELKRIRGRT